MSAAAMVGPAPSAALGIDDLDLLRWSAPVDRYRLEGRLGSGGSAVVHRAHDRLLGRDVAIKEFEPVRAGGEAARRQVREADLLASLAHPGLVVLHDATLREHHGWVRVRLVLELVEGPDLRALIARGPVSHDEVLQIGVDVATALAHLHRLGIVHRDVKPANILTWRSGRRCRAKLTDLGAACSSGAVLSARSSAATPAYLSPEQAERAAPRPATDVYSLGLALLEAVTGRPGFIGDAVATIGARLVRLPDGLEDAPADLRRLLGRMVDPEPAARPAAGEVERELRALRRDCVDADDAAPPRLARVSVALRLVATLTSAALVCLEAPAVERLWYAADPARIPAHELAGLAAGRLLLRRGGRPGAVAVEQEDRGSDPALAVRDAQGELGWLTLRGGRPCTGQILPQVFDAVRRTTFGTAAADEAC